MSNETPVGPGSPRPGRSKPVFLIVLASLAGIFVAAIMLGRILLGGSSAISCGTQLAGPSTARPGFDALAELDLSATATTRIFGDREHVVSCSHEGVAISSNGLADWPILRALSNVTTTQGFVLLADATIDPRSEADLIVRGSGGATLVLSLDAKLRKWSLTLYERGTTLGEVDGSYGPNPGELVGIEVRNGSAQAVVGGRPAGDAIAVAESIASGRVDLDVFVPGMPGSPLVEPGVVLARIGIYAPPSAGSVAIFRPARPAQVLVVTEARFDGPTTVLDAGDEHIHVRQGSGTFVIGVAGGGDALYPLLPGGWTLPEAIVEVELRPWGGSAAGLVAVDLSDGTRAIMAIFPRSGAWSLEVASSSGEVHQTEGTVNRVVSSFGLYIGDGFVGAMVDDRTEGALTTPEKLAIRQVSLGVRPGDANADNFVQASYGGAGIYRVSEYAGIQSSRLSASDVPRWRSASKEPAGAEAGIAGIRG